MEQKTIHLTECDDLQITSHLNVEALPQFLQDLLSVAHTTEQKDMLLLSLLTNASYALPRMRAYHGDNRHDYGPELMTMVLAALMFDLLPDTKPTELTTISGSLQQKQFLAALPESFSTGECIALAGKMGVAQRTAERYISQMVSTGQLINLKHGIYKKCV